MTYFYRVGWQGWEENDFRILCHETRFSAEDINRMFLEIIREVAPAEVERAEKEYNLEGETVDIDDIWKPVIDTLIERHGFIRLPIEEEFTVFPHRHEDPDDWQKREDIKGLSGALIYENKNRFHEQAEENHAGD